MKGTRPEPVYPPSRRSLVERLLAVGVLLVVTAAGAPLTAQRAAASLVENGDGFWRDGRYPEARAAYASAVALDSAASSRAVYRLGVLLSWDNALPQSIRLFELYTRLEPQDEEGRIALARTHAWAGQYARAVAIYDSITTRDRTYQAAALGAAQTLAWAGRHRLALERYRSWLASHPADQAAALAYARTLAWAGRLKESEAEYRRLEANGELLEASKGIAIVAAWRGDLDRSRARWKWLTARAPKDPEVWVGLAQVDRWAGRAEDARASLRKALEVNPTHPDAREQMRWVRADLAGTVEPTANTLWDSDGNHTSVYGVSASVRPASRTRLSIGGSYRDATLGSLEGSARTMRSSLRVGPVGWLTATGEVGSVALESPGATPNGRTKTIAAGRAAIQPRSGLSFGASYGRRPFDETAVLIRSGIEIESLAADGEVRLPARLSLAGGYDRTRFTGGSVPNERRVGFTSLRWTPSRRWSISASGRSLHFDASPHDGYFSPARYRHGEVGSRWSLGRDLGWAFTAEGALGIQEVGFAGPSDRSATQRLGGTIAYRPSPGSEISASYHFSNVAGVAAGVVSATSLYHASVVSIGARVIW